MSTIEQKNRRILVVDDNPAIHEDFGKILSSDDQHIQALDDLESELFGAEERGERVRYDYEIDSALQGDEGVSRVANAMQSNRPYAMAFVDMRMPPGCNGVEAIERMWQVDADLQVVVCTAYSDYTWTEMVQRLGPTDRLLILKKPFDNVEVCQLALALTEKFHLRSQAKLRMEDLEHIVQKRTFELRSEIDERKRVEVELRALWERVKHQATHDEVTGVWNRNAIFNILEETLQQQDFGNGVVILFLDVDHFKRVNDEHGHAAGDDVLREITNRLQRALGEGDSLGRYGGEEFLIVLRNCSLKDGFDMAEILRGQINGNAIEYEDREIPVTISLGLTYCAFKPEADLERLLRQADEALYEAKNQGRDRTKIWVGAKLTKQEQA